jgi:hypothetical protein
MDFRIAAHSVLRGQSAIHRSVNHTLHARPCQLRRVPCIRRTFSSRSLQYAQHENGRSQDSSSAEAPRPDQSAESATGPTPGSKRRITDTIQDFLQNGRGDRAKSATGSRFGTTHHKSVVAQAETRSSEPSEGLAIETPSDIGQPAAHESSPETSSKSSADILSQEFSMAQWASNFRDERRRKGKLDTSSLMTPTSMSTVPPPLIYRPARPLQPTIKLGPNVGRTIELDASRGVDVARGLSLLSMLCARNKVKADQIRQKFHERPGMKRKRLKSQRWRRRFNEGFKDVVKRVQKLRKQGW